jgi:hypothetical protein
MVLLGSHQLKNSPHRRQRWRRPFQTARKSIITEARPQRYNTGSCHRNTDSDQTALARARACFLAVCRLTSMGFGVKYFNAPEHFRSLSIESGGEADNGPQRGTFLATLQLADVRRVVASLERKIFLRKALRLANFPKNLAEEVLRGRGSFSTAMLLHTQNDTATIQTIVPETIVPIRMIGKEGPQ